MRVTQHLKGKTGGNPFLPEHRVPEAANSKQEQNHLQPFSMSAPRIVHEASLADIRQDMQDNPWATGRTTQLQRATTKP